MSMCIPMAASTDKGLVTSEPLFTPGTVNANDAAQSFVYGSAGADLSAASTAALDASFVATAGEGYVAVSAMKQGEYGWFKKAASPF